MGDFGMKISLPGYGVGTATLQQTAFTSKYPIYKVAFQGSQNVSVTAGDGIKVTVTTATFSHNLGYIPAFRCYVYIDGSSTQRQAVDCTSFLGLANNNYLQARIDATNLIFQVSNYNNSSYTVNFYYYIYADAST